MDSVRYMFPEKINIALKLSNPESENKINNLKNRYLLVTAHLYLEEADDKEFQEIIAQEGFVNELDTIVSRIQTKLKDIIKEYNNQKINITPERIKNDDYCCKKQMTLNETEFVCSICNRCSPYHEYVCKNCKINKYNHMKHFHKWMLRIQGGESREEIGNKNDPRGEMLLNEIRINYGDKLSTINDVRAALKKMKRPNLNKNASLILQQVTDIKPPKIPGNLYKRIQDIFDEIFQQKQQGTRINYPFYIFQIIDEILPEHDNKRGILEFIPMQSDITWNKNLKKWNEVYDNISYMFER